MKKRNSALLKRLEQYSVLAAPMIASAGFANAQVVYHDIDPDVILSSPGDSMLLDLNNDGMFDYTFRTIGYTLNWNKACVGPANIAGTYTIADKNAILGTYTLGSGATVYAYPAAIGLGNPINSNKPMFDLHNLFFTYSGTSAFRFPAMLSAFNAYQYGKWKDGEDHFVGFKFTPDAGTTFYFGWARCLVSTDATTITIKDYAYQSEAGMEIAAGEGVNIGIHNPEKAGEVKIVESNFLLQVNFTTVNLTDASIRLFNVVGEEIMNRKVTTAQNTISLKQLPAGLYLVQVNYEGRKVSKKIIVN